MSIGKTTKPYEFLVRWDENTGVLRAYHFKTITTTKDGDEVLGVKESGAMNAQMAQDAGFPFEDIIKLLHVDALTAVDLARKDTATAEEATRLAVDKAFALEQALAEKTAATDREREQLVGKVIETNRLLDAGAVLWSNAEALQARLKELEAEAKAASKAAKKG